MQRLMYSMVCRRADRGFAAGCMKLYMKSPTKSRWDFIEWDFWCIAGIKSVGVGFRNTLLMLIDQRGLATQPGQDKKRTGNQLQDIYINIQEELSPGDLRGSRLLQALGQKKVPWIRRFS